MLSVFLHLSAPDLAPFFFCQGVTANSRSCVLDCRTFGIEICLEAVVWVVCLPSTGAAIQFR